jgi:hypothetical protein
MATTTSRRSSRPPVSHDLDPALRLRQSMAAVRLSCTWLGVRKTLTPQQKAQAADTFGAERDYLSAGKKLLDTSHPAFKQVTQIKGKAVQYWKALTLPYPEPGIRLLPQRAVQEFSAQMQVFQSELTAAVNELEQQYDELRELARGRLGDLFHAGDYPPTLIGLFAIEHDFTPVEPPPYLQTLAPDVYREECRRVQARFEEAVHLAEQAFVEELSQLVSHLTERLAGSEDGKPKVFRDTAVVHLTEFFDRFRTLNIRSNPQLDDLVVQCRQIIGGVSPHALRKDQSFRQRIATDLSAVASNLEGLLVDRPRRRVLRQPR